MKLINKDNEMNLLMKAVKAIHSLGNHESIELEDVKSQRSAMELFSHLVPTASGLNRKEIMISNIKAVITTPDDFMNKKNLVLYCHGGGFTCGEISYAQILADKLCAATNMAVVSFEYRLAPENPYPAAVEDLIRVWDYIMLTGYGAKDVFVAGDSAGGNMALQLCRYLKHEERKLPKALILMSPFTDMTMSGSSYNTWADKDPMLTAGYIKAIRSAYAGENADFANPCFSPLFEDFTDYPPMLIQVGSNEILRSDSEELKKRVRKADGYAKLSIYRDMWHVFQQMPLPSAGRAMSEITEFVSELINS